MLPAFISFRDSIRWLPDDASEPTHTVVLTATDSGVFLDVRFEKETGQLDWAFAGYRSSPDPNHTKFTHYIDSRTQNALAVVDIGTNTQLADGRTLEAGEMINPTTGTLTKYEEVWRDLESNSALFLRNTSASVWRARVGNWQLALGRTDGEFWAWQAERSGPEQPWVLKYSTKASPETFLPDSCLGWEAGTTIEWCGESWEILAIAS
ncbi:hypothetical protein FB45DRAFT_1033257 [Roridomyces roridus]|uniref:Protein HRI1 n=1 Tax=Roridomyces roridus TaxID=1738132 RepID=A0AAD7FGQ9_9AGAR|nr:hypothetical protein FB45DRAFT_1033257 [Roridomyces roridus]